MRKRAVMLTDVKYIQNIGRFENASPLANAGLGRCTLVFGENGWGKSTLADILRSLDDKQSCDTDRAQDARWRP